MKASTSGEIVPSWAAMKYSLEYCFLPKRKTTSNPSWSLRIADHDEMNAMPSPA